MLLPSESFFLVMIILRKSYVHSLASTPLYLSRLRKSTEVRGIFLVPRTSSVLTWIVT